MRFSTFAGIRRISLQTIWISFTVGLLAYQAAADSAFISVPLQRTGVDPNASGLVTINLGATNSSMTLLASNLTGGRTFKVLVTGIERGRFVADGSGRGRLKFARPAASGALLFDFDPRGHQVLVVDNGNPVLQARISGAGEPRGSVVDEQVRIPMVPGTVGGKADGRYQLSASGTRQFAVTLTNVGDTTFTVFVNGIRRGNLITSGGSGTRLFDNVAATAGPALNFDPRGMVVDIAKGNLLRFSGKFKAKADGISMASTSLVTRVIPTTTLFPNGVALARRWVDADARREFDVELFNVPAGEYELYADGVFQGFIPVLGGATGSAGEMQFSTDPDDEDERPLNFDPFRAFYIVLGADGVVFEGKPFVPTAAITNITVIPSVMPTDIELPLFSLGVDPDGTARAQLKIDDQGRRHFEVELKDVPKDQYYLMVDDLPFGVIFVVKEGDRTRGLLELEDDPEVDELPLTFDPRGRVIAIDRGIDPGDKRFFQRGFPSTP